MKTNLHRMITISALGMALALSSCVNPYYGWPYPQSWVGAGYQSGRPLGVSQVAINRSPGYYGGSNRYYRSSYYGVRSRPVYVHRTTTPYRYGGWGYSPYRDVYSPYGYGGWGAPYRSGMVVSSFGRPAFGSGWGYNPYCW